MLEELSAEQLKTQQLNDLLRTTMLGMCGRVVMTHGVANHPNKEAVITAVREFDQFTEDNDPHGEHDFGSFEIDHERFFWKIDYYDRDYQYGSEDPANHDITGRLLTIMLAEEY